MDNWWQIKLLKFEKMRPCDMPRSVGPATVINGVATHEEELTKTSIFDLVNDVIKSLREHKAEGQPNNMAV